MKTFVIGDIHGAYKALVQCFERSGFDHDKDRLIVLGDVCDGYPEVRRCIDEMLKIEHCDYIIGNHDLWALDWATKGIEEELWLGQGGRNTKASYGRDKMPQAHIDLLKNAQAWMEFEDKLFVHGGFDPAKPISKQSLQILVWDRDLLSGAWKKYLAGQEHQFGTYKEIFVGHTPTQQFHSVVPVHFCNVWDLDTGAGWSGKLTIMNVDTKEYWQSDPTPQLYGAEGRKG